MLSLITMCSLYSPGLESVRHLTSQGRWNLRVDLRDKSGNSAYAAYSNFRLGSEESFYPLLFDTYTGGTAGRLCETEREM